MFKAAPTPYHPYESGRYTVSAGLYRLGSQPIEGRIETHTFSFDETYPAYIAAKVAARTRALHEYYALAGLTPELREAGLTFMAQAAAHDSAGVLTWDGQTLTNHALGWAGTLDLKRGTLEALHRFPSPNADIVQHVTPLDALDFLAMNVQEDVSLLCRRDDSNYLAALHVLLPEKWNPLDKIGRDFVAVHGPIPGSGPMNATAPKLLDAIIARGPFARFVWGVTASKRLDHHPHAPAEHELPHDPAQWFLRAERQTLHGFPAERGALFTIRAYVYPLATHLDTPGRAAALAAGVRSMTPDQLTYKGLTQSVSTLLAWLAARARVDS